MWTRASNPGGDAPSARRAHSSVSLDDQHIAIFGGGDGSKALNDVYVLDAEPSRLHWTKVIASGTAPPPRAYQASTLVDGKLIVHGGSDGARCFSDLFMLDMRTASSLFFSHFSSSPARDAADMPLTHPIPITAHRPSFSSTESQSWQMIDQGSKQLPRLSHTATQVGGYIFSIGGHNSNDYTADVSLLNLGACFLGSVCRLRAHCEGIAMRAAVTMRWESRAVTGTPPAPRGSHSCVMYDARLFMFGGLDGSTAYGDMHILDLSTSAYLAQVPFKLNH